MNVITVPLSEWTLPHIFIGFLYKQRSCLLHGDDVDGQLPLSCPRVNVGSTNQTPTFLCLTTVKKAMYVISAKAMIVLLPPYATTYIYRNEMR